MKAVIRSFALLNMCSTHSSTSSHLLLPQCSSSFSAKCIDIPIKKKSFILPEHFVQNVFHRLYKEPDLDFGQLRKIQSTQESQLHSTGRLDYSRVSVWTEPLLKQYFVVRKGRQQSRARAPFCRTTLLILLL